MDKKNIQLKNVLERLYAKYNHRELIAPDPLQFVYRYSEPRDMEIAALLPRHWPMAASHRLKKVSQVCLSFMGKSPFQFILKFDKSKAAGT